MRYNRLFFIFICLISYTALTAQTVTVADTLKARKGLVIAGKTITSITETVNGASTTKQVPTALSVWNALSGYLSTGTTFAGDVTGPYSNLQIGSGTVGVTELIPTGTSSGSFSAPTITVGLDGRITSASNGAAGGDLSGPLGNLQIVANAVGTTEILDNSVSANKIGTGQVTMAKINQSGATTNQAIVWNGTAWAPGTVSGGAGASVDTFGIYGANLLVSLTSDGQPAKSVAASSILSAANGLSGIGVLNRVPIFTGAGSGVTTQPYYSITYSDADAITQSIGSYSYFGQIPAYIAPYMGQNVRVIDGTGAVKVQNAGLAPSMITLTDGGGLSYYASATTLAANTNLFTNTYLKWKVDKNGNMAVGGVVTPEGRIHVKGSGTTSGTKTQYWTNGDATKKSALLDNGFWGLGTDAPVSEFHLKSSRLSGYDGQLLFEVGKSVGNGVSVEFRRAAADNQCLFAFTTVNASDAEGFIGSMPSRTDEIAIITGTGGGPTNAFYNFTNNGLLISPFNGSYTRNAMLHVKSRSAGTAKAFILEDVNGAEIFAVRDNKEVIFPGYPNTVNTAGAPVNVYSSSATGVLESHTVSELVAAGGGITGTAAANSVPYWNAGATTLTTGGLTKDATNLNLENGLGLKLISPSAANMILNATATEGTIQTYGSVPLKLNPLGNGVYIGGLAGGTGKALSLSAAGLVGVIDVGTGTVTTTSVATANGFSGTVANPTTTPAITLSTTITGLLKGNGTAISAAVAGTDYVTPSMSANQVITTGNYAFTIDASTASSTISNPLTIKGKADGTNSTQSITFANEAGTAQSTVTVTNVATYLTAVAGKNLILGVGTTPFWFKENGSLLYQNLSVNPSASGNRGGLFYNSALDRFAYSDGTNNHYIAKLSDVSGSNASYTSSQTLQASVSTVEADANVGAIVITVDGTMTPDFTTLIRATRNNTNTVTITAGSGYVLKIDGDAAVTGSSYQLTSGEIVTVRRNGTVIFINK